MKGYVSYKDYLNMAGEYVAKTTIAEALKEEGELEVQQSTYIFSNRSMGMTTSPQ